MPSIADTIKRLQAAQSAVAARNPAGSTRLRPLSGFGTNPGALNGLCYVPETGADMALVVVLHGCTQTAAGYDRGSGWSDLAARYGFAVLFPEQQRGNNPNLCFNWFATEDTRRNGGEALSIRQMIGALVSRHAIDPTRVFVTGLSAGGAMANVMLATYPELFAGGSIIAGLPYGAAASVPQALERMRGAGHADEHAYADLIRRASPHRGPWPHISVWHGDADRTVDVVNAEAILGQWRSLVGAKRAPDRSETVDGQRRRVWLAADGREAIEDYRISGFGHGTPLKTSGDRSCGAAGAYMLEAGISSTWRQAESWGLLGQPVPVAAPATTTSSAGVEPAAPLLAPAMPGVGATIERALRSAGLMR